MDVASLLKRWYHLRYELHINNLTVFTTPPSSLVLDFKNTPKGQEDDETREEDEE